MYSIHSADIDSIELTELSERDTIVNSSSAVTEGQTPFLGDTQLEEIRTEIKKMTFFGVEEEKGGIERPAVLERGLHGVASDYNEI